MSNIFLNTWIFSPLQQAHILLKSTIILTYPPPRFSKRGMWTICQRKLLQVFITLLPNKKNLPHAKENIQEKSHFLSRAVMQYSAQLLLLLSIPGTANTDHIKGTFSKPWGYFWWLQRSKLIVRTEIPLPFETTPASWAPKSDLHITSRNLCKVYIQSPHWTQWLCMQELTHYSVMNS